MTKWDTEYDKIGHIILVLLVFNWNKFEMLRFWPDRIPKAANGYTDPDGNLRFLSRGTRISHLEIFPRSSFWI